MQEICWKDFLRPRLAHWLSRIIFLLLVASKESLLVRWVYVICSLSYTCSLGFWYLIEWCVSLSVYWEITHYHMQIHLSLEGRGTAIVVASLTCQYDYLKWGNKVWYATFYFSMLVPWEGILLYSCTSEECDHLSGCRLCICGVAWTFIHWEMMNFLEWVGCCEQILPWQM